MSKQPMNNLQDYTDIYLLIKLINLGVNDLIFGKNIYRVCGSSTCKAEIGSLEQICSDEMYKSGNIYYISEWLLYLMPLYVNGISWSLNTCSLVNYSPLCYCQVWNTCVIAPFKLSESPRSWQKENIWLFIIYTHCPLYQFQTNNYYHIDTEIFLKLQHC